MPMYDFKCIDCEHTFEKICGLDDIPACPECTSEAVVKVLSGFGGYSIKGNNSASARPKGAGYRKGSK